VAVSKSPHRCFFQLRIVAMLILRLRAHFSVARVISLAERKLSPGADALITIL